MDLRLFYQKMRKVEQEIAGEHVVIVSHETPDGGKEGVMSEAPREIAARMLVEGRARLANKDEIAQFQRTAAEGRRAAEQVQLAGRLQLNVISESDARALRGGPRGEKQ